MIGPAPILAVIVGLFHVSAYVFIRGRAGARLPLLIVAAIMGSWAGDAVGARMAIDPLRIGEFHLISASVVAWLGIGLVVVLAVLVPERRERATGSRISTVVTRSAGSSGAASDDPPTATDRRVAPASGAEPKPQAPA
jgi:hypothetical protein